VDGEEETVDFTVWSRENDKYQGAAKAAKKAAGGQPTKAGDPLPKEPDANSIPPNNGSGTVTTPVPAPQQPAATSTGDTPTGYRARSNGNTVEYVTVEYDSGAVTHILKVINKKGETIKRWESTIGPGYSGEITAITSLPMGGTVDHGSSYKTWEDLLNKEFLPYSVIEKPN
jgi:hypothetical protein